MARTEPQELSASVSVSCTVDKAWTLFNDNRLVPDWSPTVERVECNEHVNSVGTKRYSMVTIDGKQGHTVEQCTHCNEPNRLDFDIVEESFGFAHMLNRYGFSVLFEETAGSTTITLVTRYEPKKIFAKVMTSESTRLKLTDMMTSNLNSFKQFAESL